MEFEQAAEDYEPSTVKEGVEVQALLDEPGEAQVEEDSPVEEVPASLEGVDEVKEGHDLVMGRALAEEYDYLRPRRGDIRQGVILSVSPHEIIVDVGLKREGIVPESDLARLGEAAVAELEAGQEVPVCILKPVDRDGDMIVSIHRAQLEQDWERAQELFVSGEVWEGEVRGYNKGGLVIPFGRLRGFLPASQITGFPRRLPREGRMTRLAEMVGQTLLLKVIEVDRSRRRLIFSEQAAQQEKRRRERQRLFEELCEGDVRRGVVSSLCDFGAFIDLGGADGLVHISELAWERVNHPREVLQVGDEVDVYVLRLDHRRKRIGLSLKRLQPEPWSTIHERYAVEQLVECTVTNVTDFGAFAKIEPGIEGLIHISELSDGHLTHPGEVVQEGDVLLLRIVKLDAERHRLGLSLKRVSEAEREAWLAESELEEEGYEVPQVTEPGSLEEQEVEMAVVESESLARTSEAAASDRSEEELAEAVDSEGVQETEVKEGSVEVSEVMEELPSVEEGLWTSFAKEARSP